MHPVAVLVNVEGQLLMFLSDLAVNCIDVDVHIYCCIIGHIKHIRSGTQLRTMGQVYDEKYSFLAATYFYLSSTLC